MRHRRAFTLLELLVVIGVVATLATMILPSLFGAREAAKRVACLNNLHAVVIGNSSYAEYNGGRYALAAEDMTGANLKRWFGQREDDHSPFERAGPLAPFLPQGMVKPCPAFTNFREDAGQGGNDAFESGCGGYGYNDLYIGGRFDRYKSVYDKASNPGRGYATSARPADVSVSSRTVMFTDTAFKAADGAMIAYSFTHAPKWIPAPPYGGGRPNPTIHFRHGGMTNVGWVDGHASSQPMTFSAGYESHGEIPAAEAADIGLGWFGEYHENLPEANYLFDLD